MSKVTGSRIPKSSSSSSVDVQKSSCGVGSKVSTFVPRSTPSRARIEIAMATSNTKSGTAIIQMEPLPSLMSTSISKSGGSKLAPTTPGHGLQILRHFDKFYLDYHAGDSYGKILGGEAERVLFVLDHHQPRSGGRTRANIGRISDSYVNFMDGNGKTVFRSLRNQFECLVECGNVPLGSVEGDSWGFDRALIVTAPSMISISASAEMFKVTPTGVCGHKCCSCCNSCFLEEYVILNQQNGKKVGSIKCGDKLEIELDPDLSVRLKALLLAAAVLLFELYFAPCFGNVGEMGCRHLLVATLIGVSIIFILIITLIAKLGLGQFSDDHIVNSFKWQCPDFIKKELCIFLRNLFHILVRIRPETQN